MTNHSLPLPRDAGSTRMLKLRVPFDGRWHPVDIGHGIAHVGQQDDEGVTAWFMSTGVENVVEARVFGTGEDIPADGRPDYVGTVQADHGLVWHLVIR